ncbi:MoaD/ThiS family protein [Pelagerythrobacter sp.]|uniref:MoaD/ThiS family protein n=1 Tax=Pelagerythrobacter sp. TaxID=2800702 RepID=UPI0035AEFAD8
MKLVFLGKLADLAGEGEHALAVSGPLDWARLCARLDPAMREAIGADDVRVAVDGVLLPDKRDLQAGEGSEVAFLPPVSGG